LAYLARREHAAGELRMKLARRGFDSQVIDKVVDDLGERGLQDDARFIESFVNSRIGKGHGPVKISHGLRERGVVADVQTATDWKVLAADVRRRRFGASAPGDWNERSRQARFLQQRGFTGEQVRAALEGWTDEEA
jgi:regulatory protein